jgi:putative endonuclease
MDGAGFVYFMSKRKDGVIYTGVTSDLIKRVFEHKQGVVEGFTKKYNAKHLVFFEDCGSIETAIAQEKKLKNLHRAKKIEIIERANPEWKDLYESILL